MIDQHLLEHRPDASAGCREPVWNLADFLEIQSIVGRERAETLLRSYTLHLELASVMIRDSEFGLLQLREVVHNLKAMSGQLGFDALHDFCDGVLISGKTVAVDAAIAPLLALIEASRAVAQSHCGRTKIAEIGQVA